MVMTVAASAVLIFPKVRIVLNKPVRREFEHPLISSGRGPIPECRCSTPLVELQELGQCSGVDIEPGDRNTDGFSVGNLLASKLQQVGCRRKAQIEIIELLETGHDRPVQGPV